MFCLGFFSSQNESPVDTMLCCIDALRKASLRQYQCMNIERELNKLYVGFCAPQCLQHARQHVNCRNLDEEYHSACESVCEGKTEDYRGASLYSGTLHGYYYWSRHTNGIVFYFSRFNIFLYRWHTTSLELSFGAFVS